MSRLVQLTIVTGSIEYEQNMCGAEHLCADHLCLKQAIVYWAYCERVPVNGPTNKPFSPGDLYVGHWSHTTNNVV